VRRSASAPGCGSALYPDPPAPSTARQASTPAQLAPGWKVGNVEADFSVVHGTVIYDGPGDVDSGAGRAVMAVHFEAAASTELRTAGAPLFSKLEAGQACPTSG
jgi:hypothetical protein